MDLLALLWSFAALKKADLAQGKPVHKSASAVTTPEIGLPKLCFAKPCYRPDIQHKIEEDQDADEDSRMKIVFPVANDNVEDVDVETDQCSLSRT